MNKKVSQILILFAVFFVSTFSAYFFEEYFRKMVRYFFKLSTNGNIVFVGKNFHLFASYTFVIGFGFFSLLFYKTINKKKLINTLIVFSLFLISTFVISYIDSNLKLIECTACNDGKRNLNYNAINYDFIFITSLTISIIAFLIKFIRAFVAKK